MVTYIVPARYFVAILKGIYLKGVGLEIIGGQAGCWSFMAVMVLLASEVQEEIDVRSPLPLGEGQG